MKNSKICLVIFIMFFICGNLFANINIIDSFKSLENGVVGETISLEEAKTFYANIIEEIDNNSLELENHNYYEVMSEKYIGDMYLVSSNKENAKLHYEKGLELAQKALEKEKTSVNYSLVALMISMNTQVQPFSYTISNGLAIEGNAKKALNLDKKNPVAVFLYASRFIFAPPGFNNIKKGIKIIQDLEGFQGSNVEKFQLLHVLVRGFIMQENYQGALIYQKECEKLFPNNSGVKETAALIEKNL